jgi:hypothetical protein
MKALYFALLFLMMACAAPKNEGAPRSSGVRSSPLQKVWTAPGASYQLDMHEYDPDMWGSSIYIPNNFLAHECGCEMQFPIHGDADNTYWITDCGYFSPNPSGVDCDLNFKQKGTFSLNNGVLRLCNELVTPTVCTDFH